MDSPHLFGNYHGMFLDHSLKIKLFQLLLIKLRHPHSLHGTGLCIMPQFFQQANKSRLYVIAISYEYYIVLIVQSGTVIRVKGGDCFVLFTKKCTDYRYKSVRFFRKYRIRYEIPIIGTSEFPEPAMN